MTVDPTALEQGDAEDLDHDDYVEFDHTTKDAEPEPAPGPQLAYPDAATGVSEWLAHNYPRRISRGSGHVWAADWWRYPEAVSRVEAMWRAREHLRPDPATGMSV